MRENTRCEVDEPMSTPTESTHSSSSSPKVRPVEEKKMRPPWASSGHASVIVMPGVRIGETESYLRRDKPGMLDGGMHSFLRQQPAVIALVIFRPHAVLGAFALHGLGIFLRRNGSSM